MADEYIGREDALRAVQGKEARTEALRKMKCSTELRLI